MAGTFKGIRDDSHTVFPLAAKQGCKWEIALCRAETLPRLSKYHTVSGHKCHCNFVHSHKETTTSLPCSDFNSTHSIMC